MTLFCLFDCIQVNVHLMKLRLNQESVKVSIDLHSIRLLFSCCIKILSKVDFLPKPIQVQAIAVPYAFWTMQMAWDIRFVGALQTKHIQ